MKDRIWIYKSVLMTFLLIFFALTTDGFSQNKISKERENDAFAELENNSLVLRFFDSLSGSPIKGAAVVIGDEYLVTDFDGRALFAKPKEDKYLKVSFTHPNYISSEFDIEITAGTLFFNRFSISPLLSVGSLRVVLDWNSEPADLDANLLKKDDYHISFRNMKVSADGIAKLDIDDTDGLGPETITINKVEPFSEYIYFIHNFSDKHNSESASLSNSRAMVKLYGDNKLLNVFSIPLDKAGNYWEVFRIVAGQLKVIDEVKAGIE